MGRALVGLWVLLIAACSGKPAPPSERSAVEADAPVLREWFHPRSSSPITDQGQAITGYAPRTVPIPFPPSDPFGAAPAWRRTLAARRSALTPLIDAIALSEGVDPVLVHAVITQESGYHPHARSPAGAVGLMQLMPATGVRFGLSSAQRADPAQNVRAGVRYLKWLIRRFHGALPLALAGYNAGEGAVQKYGNQVPPYRETQQYVRRVLAHYASDRPRRQALMREARAHHLERASAHPVAERRDRQREASDWGDQ